MKTITDKYESLVDFLEKNCTKVTVGDNTWYYSPYWFKDEGDKLVMLDFDSLPKELIEEIKSRRYGFK